jgi:DNA-binding PadR family transcriptional regulator
MPRAKTFLTPAEYAVLGLLRRKPAYGYELQRSLSGSTGLGLVCPVEPAMVYAILKSLSGLELIDGEWDNSTYPPKAVYTISGEGELKFQMWLRRAVGRMREVRLDFMVKLFFLLDSEPDSARTLLEEQLDVCDSYALDIQERMQELKPASFDYMALGSKLSAARTTKEWLTGCLQALDIRGDGS